MASKRQRRWKACARKVRYESGHIAKHVAFVLRSKFGKMHRYKCDFCGGWHVGH